ncbi:MAG: hypothetical protein LUD00_11315 [Prevotellaceae bacterium]|nr:hypothetical protein [Prevotellaceae bacterium]
MKKLMMLVGSLMAVSTMSAQEVETVPFTTAEINLPARVRFVVGDDYSFSVESSNPYLASQLQCGVKNGVLNLKYGESLKPGTVVFDEKNDAYFYGVGVSELSLSDDNEDEPLFVVTVTAPGMPEFKTSKDYKVVPVKAGDIVAEKNLAFNGVDE